MSIIDRAPRWRRLLTHLILIMLALPCILPLVWMISTSLKTDAQIFPRVTEGIPKIGLKDLVPTPVKWSNYSEALRFVPFGTYLQNTLLLCVVNVIGAVFSSALIAYGFARTRFKGRDLLFMLMLSTLMLPPQVTMIPTFVIFKKIGWYNTFLPLMAPAFTGVPFFIFLMRQFFFDDPAGTFGGSPYRWVWRVAHLLEHNPAAFDSGAGHLRFVQFYRSLE